MKRILVFSDTHGNISLCRSVLNNIQCDMVLHTGDYVGDAQELRRLYPKLDIRYVAGNCDMYSYAPQSDIAEIDGVKIFAAHGHAHRVKYESDYRTLAKAARDNGCNVAVFGHTHDAYEGNTDGVILLNPGSARYGGTYGVIEIENGIAKVCVINTAKFGY